jgi:glycerophosphoryl diester phosphodiesterase
MLKSLSSPFEFPLFGRGVGVRLFSIIIALGVFIACSTPKKNTGMNSEMQKPPSGGLGAFDKQGHRGCRGLMPENTIPAMIHALGVGVTTLEMDVVITKDKQVILSHEPFFNHEITTKPDGSFIEEKDEKSYNMYLMNYDSIIKYDVGMKPHPRFAQQQKIKAVKPLLADVFDSCRASILKLQLKAKNIRKLELPYYNIETKTQPATDNVFHPAPAEFVELLMKVITEKQMEDFVIIQSFDFRTLQYLHKNYPAIKTAMLIEDYDKASFDDQIKKLGFTASIYSPHYSLVTAELINKCHTTAMQIIPWTVNDKKEIERLKGLGVDGIITDYPNLFNE